MKRFDIHFRYRDEMSQGEWREQSCSLIEVTPEAAVHKCKELYGLGYDCEYQIVSVLETA